MDGQQSGCNKTKDLKSQRRHPLIVNLRWSVKGTKILSLVRLSDGNFVDAILPYLFTSTMNVKIKYIDKLYQINLDSRNKLVPSDGPSGSKVRHLCSIYGKHENKTDL